MKKKVIAVSILIICILLLYVAQYVWLIYGISLSDYIRYSIGFTKDEIDLLNRYQPLIYGGNINEPPLGVYYEENGQYIGLVVDRINALSIELEVPIISKPMVWNEALNALARGETNLCDMVASEERAAYFAFSDPIYLLKGIVIVPNSNNEIKALKDLSNMRVAVQEGDYAVDLVSQIDRVQIKQTANLADALELLHNNQVDAVAGDEPVARYLLNELSYLDNYRILDEYLYETSCVFAVPKSQAELLGVINKAIFGMKHNGTMDKIEAKWSRYHSSLLKDAIARDKMILNIRTAAALLLITYLLIYLWNRSLKSLAQDKSKELDIIKNELQVTFDGMDDYLAVIGEDLNIKNINEPFLKFINTERKFIAGRPFTSIELLRVFEKKHGGILSDLLKDTEKRTSFNQQQKFEFSNHDRFYRVTVCPLGRDNPENCDILITITDCTLLRIEEHKLSYLQKMESIGQLAAGVAHELRTPLGTIRNSAYLLQGEYDEKDEVQSVALNSINSSVNRASNIIENLLKFSRLTNEEKSMVDVNASILESILPHRSRIDRQGIDLEILNEPGIELNIDSESLNHVLSNLIQNAVDAMPEGGKLTIGCRREKKSEKMIIISITDSGSGIEENSLNRLFEPFYTTKPIGKGTGLGLFIAYSEIKKASGEIRVESEIGKGTTFTISVPERSGEQPWESA